MTAPSTPRRVLRMDEMPSWEAQVLTMMMAPLTPELARVAVDRGVRVEADDLAGLDAFIGSEVGYQVDTLENVGAKLALAFDAVRAYHGARPVDTARYYNLGLQPLQEQHHLQQCEAVFLGPGFGGIERQVLYAAVEKVAREGGRSTAHVYFEKSRTFLERHSSHYMERGSEFMLGVAAALDRRAEYAQYLRRRGGLPTVFVCDVPVPLLDERQLQGLGGELIAAVFAKLRRPCYVHVVKDGQLVASGALSADCIVGHHHLDDPPP